MKEVWSAFVMDRRGGPPGLEQLDASAVHDFVVGVGRDGDSPAEVVGDAETHAPDYACGFG